MKNIKTYNQLFERVAPRVHSEIDRINKEYEKLLDHFHEDLKIKYKCEGCIKTYPKIVSYLKNKTENAYYIMIKFNYEIIFKKDKDSVMMLLDDDYECKDNIFKRLYDMTDDNDVSKILSEYPYMISLLINYMSDKMKDKFSFLIKQTDWS